jgi:hypothetical protein
MKNSYYRILPTTVDDLSYEETDSFFDASPFPSSTPVSLFYPHPHPLSHFLPHFISIPTLVLTHTLTSPPLHPILSHPTPTDARNMGKGTRVRAQQT